MTAQIAETLIRNNKPESMCTEPLEEYFNLSGARPEFEFTSTALWRGYRGTWEIVDNRLYLLEVDGALEDGSTINLATLFPGFPNRVFAHWYTGTLRVPKGKMLEYVHAAYASEYEQDEMIKVVKGVVVDTTVVTNGEAEENAPEGYAAGAALVFTKKK